MPAKSARVRQELIGSVRITNRRMVTEPTQPGDDEYPLGLLLMSGVDLVFNLPEWGEVTATICSPSLAVEWGGDADAVFKEADDLLSIMLLRLQQGCVGIASLKMVTEPLRPEDDHYPLGWLVRARADLVFPEPEWGDIYESLQSAGRQVPWGGSAKEVYKEEKQELICMLRQLGIPVREFEDHVA